MYEVKLINNGIETIIHYPTADQGAPHLNKLPLKEGLSLVDSLSFVLYVNKAGYNEVFELITKVKVIDVRDNSVRFTGRVLDINERMDSNGLFYKEITCEGALSYLNDTKQRANSFIISNLTDFLTQILAIHNEKVDSSRQIQVGNVDVTGSVAYTCNFKTTLEEILAAKESIGGNIRVRETGGVLYLDWLQSFSSSNIEVTLGVNMKDMVKEKDVTSFGTRIIPLGANNLTIESVNSGVDYIEDANAKAIYGVIEKTVEYTDITDAQELYDTCLADLSDYTQPSYSLECNALDLSYITGITANQFALGSSLHIVNSVMAIDDVYIVVTTDLDLLEPYNPTLTIENNPVKLTTTITDLRKTSIQNNSVKNGVQIGDDFGIRVSSSDGNIITLINATEGISIEDLIKNLKVFYVDTEGNVIHDGKHQTTHDGNVLIENWKNENGGLTQIYDLDGNLNIKIGSENGTSDNNGGTLILYDDGEDNPRVELGVSSTYGSGTINLKDVDGTVRAVLYASSNLGPIVALRSSTGVVKSYLAEEEGKINGQEIATKNWVIQYVADNMPSSEPTT